MRINVMIKALSTFMAIAVLIISFSAVVSAENDAVDLGYRLQITVTDENGAAKDAFLIGEMIYVKLSLTYTGAGKAPVYGLQGELHYDSYVIRNTSVKEKSDVKAQATSGQITYVFLDMTGQGKSDSMLGNIGEAVFVAKSNGTVSLYGDNFIVTNKDASQRYIDASKVEKLTIGTGVKDVTKEILEADIAAAEKMLADCTVTDASNTGIYYPGFWVTTQTAETFQAAIDMAKAVYENTDATQMEIESAVTKLDTAVKLFEQSKIFGARRWSSSNVTVTALVKGGNGKIAPGFIIQECRLDTSCTIRMQPDEGYETEYVYVNGKQFLGSDIFTIPSVSRDTTVSVTFCKKPPFTDIAHSDWFYISARYAYNKGLFQGTTETEFSPSSAMSRAMLATVLYRMEGQPAVSFTEAFSDIEKGIWYTDAILWASENNIVKGYGNGIFAPNDFITREQIAVMLYRYAKGKAVAEKEKITLSYSDASDISAYAAESMTWAVAEGLIKGNTETTINPRGIATRAEVATILMRYDELL